MRKNKPTNQTNGNRPESWKAWMMSIATWSIKAIITAIITTLIKHFM